jgi:ribosomal protein S18 acetylase RimI-like enzyme
MKKEDGPDIEIHRLKNTKEAEICARMMADSEPWMTLRRGYDDSLKMIEDRSYETNIASVGGEISGFVVILMHGAFVGYIKSICVSPRWRNRGIGSRLMSFAEGRIFGEAPNVFICVSSFNEGARRFYERLGYEVVGELKNYIVSGHSEILMRKTIAPLAEFEER